LHGIASKAAELGKQTEFDRILELDAQSFGMVWRRLGLKRSGTGYWAQVNVERTRRSGIIEKLVILDKKPLSF